MTIKLKEIIPLNKYKFDNIYHLDKCKVYTVIGIESPYYVLISENGTLSLHPMLFFDIVDNTMDEDWIVNVTDSGNDPYDIQICIESKELKNFNYDDFYNYGRESCDFFIHYLKRKNIVFVSNLAYCPIRPRKKYYKELLEKIEQQLKEKISL